VVVVQDVAERRGPCLLIDTDLLEQSGTIAIVEANSGPRVQVTQGNRRIWSATTVVAGLFLPDVALPDQ
jgi:hypothetical protein